VRRARAHNHVPKADHAGDAGGASPAERRLDRRRHHRQGFSDCVEDLDFLPWTQRATDAASKAGVVRTPTIRVNGETLAVATLSGLQAAVLAARG
jgi:hypothetical protein